MTPADLAAAYEWRPLALSLARMHHGGGEEEDAASDAVIYLAARWQQYDPARGTLYTFVKRVLICAMQARPQWAGMKLPRPCETHRQRRLGRMSRGALIIKRRVELDRPIPGGEDPMSNFIPARTTPPEAIIDARRFGARLAAMHAKGSRSRRAAIDYLTMGGTMREAAEEHNLHGRQGVEQAIARVRRDLGVTR